MNKIYQTGLALSLALLSFSSCTSWTEVETQNIETPAIIDQLRQRDIKKWAEEKNLQKKEDEDTKAYNEKVQRMYDAYWKSLREYKNSAHQVTYGWFGGWSATEGLPQSFLSNLPDSVDMVSIWGGTDAFAENSSRAKDLKYAQEVKGLKVVLCWQVSDIGLGLPEKKEGIIAKVKALSDADKKARYAGYGVEDPTEEQMQIIEYALTLTEFIEKHGFDGFDIDYEPHVGDHKKGVKLAFAGDEKSMYDNMRLFIRVMGKMYGPKSGRKGKLLMIDGELSAMGWGHKTRRGTYKGGFPDMGVYFDWFIEQAYGKQTDESLNKFRYAWHKDKIEGFSADKYIVADEFEKNGGSLLGGAWAVDHSPLTEAEKNEAEAAVRSKNTPSEQKARWTPEGAVRKGGWAAYHIELETPTNFKYVRRVIQIMNPAKYRP